MFSLTLCGDKRLLMLSIVYWWPMREVYELKLTSVVNLVMYFFLQRSQLCASGVGVPKYEGQH
jgi:hypothetical protein